LQNGMLEIKSSRNYGAGAPLTLKIGARVLYRRAIIDEWLETRSCEDFTHGE
jgi:hypothetical protein